MDGDALNMRNWGYYEPSLKAHLGLQLMSTIGERDVKHFMPGRDPSAIVNMNAAFHPRESVVSEAPVATNWARDGWINHRDKLFNVLSPNTSYSLLAETSAAQPLQILQPLDTSRDEMVLKIEEPPVKKGTKQPKKRQNGGAPKTPKPKKPRKPKNNDPSVQQVKAPKKKMELVINGFDMDISSIPIPVCSCTGTPHQCYRWGYGGWQSACCTTSLSLHPLPMSEKRRGARIAGRKMSQGAFKKVLEKLAAQGYNFSNPIDLRSHWARHGTNKFVTIRSIITKETDQLICRPKII
ncbi:protein BASIC PENTACYSTEINE2 isoform X1 [Cucumis sativus]|nr:protein BASIC PENTACYSTEINE2 isoform X1 [Cucumis sativus]XP_031741596.1 protein BASIC PENTACYSTEINE2 isoform X1 [Cucumis sativus]